MLDTYVSKMKDVTMNRYHINRGATRTTVTLDSTICELLSLKLGTAPDATESHKTIRLWLQSTSEKLSDGKTKNLSQWLKQKAVLYIADSSLLSKHHQWKDEIDQSWNEELEKRVSDVDSGAVEMVSKADVFKAARDHLS